MAIYLPQTVEEELIALDELTPREIVAELDKYVVGQHDAKRAVAIALRNRMRRQKLTPEMAEEVMPKNIIMIGPTGVGKTEIARRQRTLRLLFARRGETRHLEKDVAPFRILVETLFQDGDEILPDFRKFLRIGLGQLGEVLQQAIGDAFLDGREKLALLHHFARDIERQVG